MEYIKKDDLNAIQTIIEEFEGETILGRHMFKAIKAYFKQKNELPTVIYTEEQKMPKKHTLNRVNEIFVDNILKGADEALTKYNLKLRKQRGKNGKTKTQKKN